MESKVEMILRKINRMQIGSQQDRRENDSKMLLRPNIQRDFSVRSEYGIMHYILLYK